jgi:hypothetical protein
MGLLYMARAFLSDRELAEETLSEFMTWNLAWTLEASKVEKPR